MANEGLRVSNPQKIRPYTPTNTANSFIELAKTQAQKSNYGNFRHGAVLVSGGRVINTGYNKDRFTNFGSRFRPCGFGNATLHAELDAILNIDRKKTQGATIYVVRISNDRDLFRNSKPCSMCHAALMFVGIKQVIYSLDENNFESYTF